MKHQFNANSTTTTKAKSKIAAWIDEQRDLFAAGELPNWKIQRLEKIPGWTWTVNAGSASSQEAQ